MRTNFLAILLLGCLLYTFSAFEAGDEIRIMVNKVSPFANPTESYRFSNLIAIKAYSRLF